MHVSEGILRFTRALRDFAPQTPLRILLFSLFPGVSGAEPLMTNLIAKFKSVQTIPYHYYNFIAGFGFMLILESME